MIIRRYVFGEFLKPFLWCLVLFVSLFWVMDLLDHQAEIVKAKVPLFVIWDYYVSLTPFIFVTICPIIILLATIFTFSGFNRHNEITALKAIGINLWSVISLFLLFGLFMSALTFAVNEVIKPDASLHAENLKEEYFKPRTKKAQNHIMESVTLYGAGNRIFIIGSYDTKRQQMSNITISENDVNNRQSRHIAAQKAQWLDGFWMFYDCIITEYDAAGVLQGEPTHYPEKMLLIDEKPKDFKRANILPDLMSFWQLKKYIRRLQNNQVDPFREKVTFYNKLAFPLANFIVIFFAIPFTLTRQRQDSALLGVTLSIAVSFSYWGINAVSLSLGKIGVLPAILAAWLPNILFFFIGIWLIDAIQK